MNRVLFETGVLLDVLADRAPFADDAQAALVHVETGDLIGLVAANTVTTLQDVLVKHVGKAGARRVVLDLLLLFRVEPVDEDRIRHALGLGWKSFGNAVQAACAENAEADRIVTRDSDGFKRAAVKPISPAELLALL